MSLSDPDEKRSRQGFIIYGGCPEACRVSGGVDKTTAPLHLFGDVQNFEREMEAKLPVPGYLKGPYAGRCRRKRGGLFLSSYVAVWTK